MELETAPAKDDDWLIVNVQGTSHTASTNKHISCTICNVLHAVIHIEQFEHLCFPFSLMLYYSTFKSCKHLLLLFLLGCMLHKAAPFGIQVCSTDCFRWVVMVHTKPIIGCRFQIKACLRGWKTSVFKLLFNVVQLYIHVIIKNYRGPKLIQYLPSAIILNIYTDFKNIQTVRTKSARQDKLFLNMLKFK